MSAFLTAMLALMKGMLFGDARYLEVIREFYSPDLCGLIMTLLNLAQPKLQVHARHVTAWFIIMNARVVLRVCVLTAWSRACRSLH